MPPATTVDLLKAGPADEGSGAGRDEERRSTDLFCSGLIALLQADFAGADALFQSIDPACVARDLHADLILLGAVAHAHRAAADDRLIAGLMASRDRLSQSPSRGQPGFESKLLLLDAEIARVGGDWLAALQLYDQAAGIAAGAGIAQEEGLAHELAGGLSERCGLHTAALAHRRQAQGSFHRWRAHVEARFPDAGLPCGVSHVLDAATHNNPDDPSALVETAQALSEELYFDRLIDRLMEGMLRHAGAYHGCLVLLEPSGPRVRAMAQLTAQGIRVDARDTEVSEADFPASILDAVLRSGRAFLVCDAARDASLADWVAMVSRPVRSLLCLPLARHGAVSGLLLLENGMATDAFSQGRMEALAILARQAAISFETARLHAGQIEGKALLARSEASLRRTRAELAKTSQLTVMGSLAASIAHEINQPLAVIASNAGAGLRWLRQSPPNVQEAMASLTVIRDDGLRAGGIIKALRALAKQGPAALERTGIDGIIRHVLEIMALENEAKRVNLSLDLQAADEHILGDPVQLQQLMHNLVSNAVEAVEGQPPSGRQVRVATKREGVVVVVRIADSGPGLAREALDQIFDPFYTTKEGGMGMGLVISRSIVEAHGGTLAATSREGEGTVFECRIPLVQGGRSSL